MNLAPRSWCRLLARPGTASRSAFPSAPSLRVLFAATLLLFAAPAVADRPVAFDPGLEELAARARSEGAVRVLVELEPQAAADRSSLGTLSDDGVSATTRFATIPWLAATVDEVALRRLPETPGVRRVMEDRLLRPLGDLGQAVGATELRAEGLDGRGQRIAIVDVGFSQPHPALAGRIVEQACFSSQGPPFDNISLCRDRAPEAFGANATEGCVDAPGCGHGLHVAGIAAMDFVDGNGEQHKGVAPGAEIVMVNVFSYLPDYYACGSPNCIYAFTSDVIRGLEWVLSRVEQDRIAAVNLSLGGGLWAGPCPEDPMALVLAQLVALDVPVVVAAGNDGAEDAVAVPACAPGVIAVGATRSTWYAADFSNSGELVTLWAPGQSIRSACGVDGTCVMSGTSMAAPHVAGSLAVLRQLWPSARVDQLLAALVDRSLSGLDDYSRSIRVIWLRDVQSSRVVAPPPTIDGPRELAPGQPGAFRLSGTATMAGEPVDFRMEWGDGSVSAWSSQLPNGTGEISGSLSAPGTYQLRSVARSQDDVTSTSLRSPPFPLLVVDLDPDGPDLETRLARLRLKCNLTTCTLSGTIAVSNRGRARSASTDWDVRALRCPAGSCSSLFMRSGRLASLGSGKTRSYSFKYRMMAWQVADVVSIGARADTANKLVEASEINNEVSAPLP